MLWPPLLSDVIVRETNRYARSKGKAGWVDVTRDELYAFLGIIVLMGIHRIPNISDYFSTDLFLGLPPVRDSMSSSRFWELWTNLHVVDNSKALPTDGITGKIKPIIDVLGETFVTNYSPGQELCVDEAMVKYKGHARGKVHMPKKPIKTGFKIWCCCCSCCGYLCTFKLYEGKPLDQSTGKRVSEKGLIMRVVQDLVGPFIGMNHVLYCDNFFTSGPLVEALLEDDIYVTGTIQQRAAGFPGGLKGVKPGKGCYAVEKVGNTSYFVFDDRSVVSFVTNVFPEHMEGKVARVQSDGLMHYQSVPPLLPAYNRYMGGVDRLNQMRKTYGYDRKAKRYWLRLFFQLFDYSVHNAYLVYVHNCRTYKSKAVNHQGFRILLVRLLLTNKRYRKGSARVAKVGDGGQGTSGCSLSRVSEIGLKRGRCLQCTLKRRDPVRHTSFGCSFCGVRLCKVTCFAEYHQH